MAWAEQAVEKPNLHSARVQGGSVPGRSRQTDLLPAAVQTVLLARWRDPRMKCDSAVAWGGATTHYLAVVGVYDFIETLIGHAIHDAAAN